MAETRKKGFNLAEALGAVAVPDLGTAAEGREQIEYIDIDRIDDDPNNFYELSFLDELAANIELLGLQQPLRVRANPEDADRVIIVSGHRRRAAIRKLVDEGRTDLREIPCIRERGESSAALQELRLIYANSDTRKLTSAEVSKQAERVEMLLYQLKEEGYKFPGRMRDHVAEACKVSKSKLSRLKVIRDNLIPEYAEYFQKGELSESSAYRLAKEPKDIQRLVWKYDGQDDAERGRLSSTTEWQIDNTVGRIKKIIERRCKHPDGTCTHCEVMLGKVFTKNAYPSCTYHCCDDCPDLRTCKDVCPKMAEKAAKLKLDTKTKRTEEKAATKALDQANAKAIGQLWKRFGEARAAGGKSVDECFDRMNIKYTSISREKYPAYEKHEEKLTGKTGLPFGFALDLEHIRRLTNLADLLGCSLDYLLCRTDDPAAGGSAGSESASAGVAWYPPSVTPELGQMVVVVYADGFADGCLYQGGGTLSELDWSDIALWTPVPMEATATELSTRGGWRLGIHPPEVAGECVAVFDMGDGGSYFRTICYFDGNDFRIGREGAPIKETLVRWMPLPPEPGEGEKTSGH